MNIMRWKKWLQRSSSHEIVAKNLSREQIENLKIGQGTNPIPVEWQQWMRKTRKEAPTPEEILMNEHLKMRANEADRKHENWKKKKADDKKQKIEDEMRGI